MAQTRTEIAAPHNFFSSLLGAQEVCEQLQGRIPLVLLHHKDPAASVTTVLNRLVAYGEALKVHDENGRRAWQWYDQGRANVSAKAIQIKCR